MLLRLASSGPPTAASQSAGISGVSHCAQPVCSFSFYIALLKFISFFFKQSLAMSPGWSAVARSWLTATSASWDQAIILLQSPE